MPKRDGTHRPNYTTNDAQTGRYASFSFIQTTVCNN